MSNPTPQYATETQTAAPAVETASGMNTMSPPDFSLESETELEVNNDTEETTASITYDGYTCSVKEDDNTKLIVKQGETVIKDNIDIASARAYLIGGSGDGEWDNSVQYNYNTAIRLAKYVGDTIDGITYTVSTDLDGTSADDAVIIPDNIIMGICLLQASNELAVDGKAGGGFVKGVIGEFEDQTSNNARLNYMDKESDNTDLVDENGDDIDIPDFSSASEETLYDFFQDIVAARNGLWSTNADITNLVGLRRDLDTAAGTVYNDTQAICWLEVNGTEETKHCKTYIASTQPGSQNTSRQLRPQTMLTTLGMHGSERQSGGRNSHLLVAGSNNSGNSLDFDATDGNGFNMHPGGLDGLRGGMSVSSSELSGIPGNGGAMNESEFQIQHQLSEIFYLLGKWGKTRNQAAYDYLKDANDEAVAAQANAEGGDFDQTAIDDYDRITTLFEELETNLENANKSQNTINGYIDYLKETIEFSKDVEDEILGGTHATWTDSELDDGSTKIDHDVSDSSHGCQVVLGGANFYDYWWTMQENAEDSGQRRWYYNLIDLTENYNAIETEAGQE